MAELWNEWMVLQPVDRPSYGPDTKLWWMDLRTEPISISPTFFKRQGDNEDKKQVCRCDNNLRIKGILLCLINIDMQTSWNKECIKIWGDTFLNCASYCLQKWKLKQNARQQTPHPSPPPPPRPSFAAVAIPIKII